MNPQNQNNQPTPVPNATPQPAVAPQVFTPQTPAPQGVVGGSSPNVAQYSQPAPISPAGKSKRKLFVALAILVAVLVIGGIIVAATHKSKPTPADTSSLDINDSPPDQSTADTKAPALTKSPLTQTITTDLGYTVQLNELVRNYPAEHPDPGTETVLVKVVITEVNSQYTGSSPYSTDFSLVAGDKSYTNSLIVGSHELATAGYTTLPADSATKDKPTSGYIAFDVPTGTDKLTFRYTQKERKILNGGQTIPAKNYDVAVN